MSLAIEATGLEKTYPPKVRALDGLSLSVEACTIFGLLGPNGAGKSTTVRVLTTLTRPEPRTARVAGVDVLAEPRRVRGTAGLATPRLRRARLVSVAQKHGFVAEATGRENLVLQGEFYGIAGG